MKRIYAILLFSAVLFGACSAEGEPEPQTQPTPENPTPEPEPEPDTTLKYLALGDSYTIGSGVCATCRFPVQLKDSLALEYPNAAVSVDIIAQSGWTTTNLKAAFDTAAPASDYDLVTLLIGVNNQFQNKPFSLYETEFPQLVNRAIVAAKGDHKNVVVVSIPDYAYTPFGQGSTDQTISSDIDQYNAFAENYCASHGIKFVYITDITREGLDNPALVASDGLHPSEQAYTRFVCRILPKAMAAINE